MLEDRKVSILKLRNAWIVLVGLIGTFLIFINGFVHAGDFSGNEAKKVEFIYTSALAFGVTISGLLLVAFFPRKEDKRFINTGIKFLISGFALTYTGFLFDMFSSFHFIGKPLIYAGWLMVIFSTLSIYKNR